MSKFVGLFMIVAGVGTAAAVYPMLGTSGDRAERQAADIAAIATAGNTLKADTAARTDTPTPRGTVALKALPPRVISAESGPGRPSIASAPVVAPVIAGLAPPVVSAAAQPLPAATSPPPPAVVARPVEAPVPQIAKKVASARADDEARSTLTRDIQRELKRVGCYSGDTDGSWNTGTRQAMKAFNDRVNATLPIEGPDHILKTLVQGHPGNACGKSCPSGQTAASDGRCMPTAIMAQVPAPAPVKRNDGVPTGALTTSALATPTAPSAPAISAWETKTIAAPTPIAPSTFAANIPVPTQARPPRADLPPGRMAIGAPIAQAAPEPAVAPPAQTGAPGNPLAGRDDPANDAKVRKSAPKIVVKPRPKPDGAVEPGQASGPTTTASIKPSGATEIDAGPRPNAAAPVLGAVAAATDRSNEPSATSTPRIERPAPRTVERRPPPPRYAGYYNTLPPPRFVGAYNTQPAFRPRERFGVQVFRDQQLNAR